MEEPSRSLLFGIVATSFHGLKMIHVVAKGATPLMNFQLAVVYGSHAHGRPREWYSMIGHGGISMYLSRYF